MAVFRVLGVLVCIVSASAFAHDLSSCERDIFATSLESLSSHNLKTGETLSVPRRRFVETDFVPLTSRASVGQVLQIEENGLIKVVEIDDVSARVQYRSPRLKPNIGECPNGAEFHLPLEEIRIYPALYRARHLARQQIHSEVLEIVTKNQPSSIELTLLDPHWALMMVKPNNHYSRFSFGDECALMRGGLIRSLGLFPNQSWTLVHYDHPNRTAGLNCPREAIVAVPTSLIVLLRASSPPS